MSSEVADCIGTSYPRTLPTISPVDLYDLQYRTGERSSTIVVRNIFAEKLAVQVEVSLSSYSKICTLEYWISFTTHVGRSTSTLSESQILPRRIDQIGCRK